MTTSTEPPFRPLIASQADLEQTWLTLMSPLGFAGSSIWLMLLGADRRPLPQLTQIEECDEPPDTVVLDGLAALLADLLAEHAPGGSWAFLRSRPGRGAPTVADRAWAAGLHEACRAAGVPAETVHLATDDTLVPLPLDDLPVRSGM